VHVAGDLLEAKQIPGIILAFGFLHAPLMGQEGRALGENTEKAPRAASSKR
jgi:hypothetical protein